MATNPTIRRISRDKLLAVFKTQEFVKLFEDVLYGVGETLPENTAAAQTAADAAQVAADAAQVAAEAAQAIAEAAQLTITDHIADTAGAHAASAITVTPVGGILSTDAQAALQELDVGKQALLVSGTSIKTVNGVSLLGAGDLVVTAADPSYTPGSFTVATGTAKLMGVRLGLSGAERATITGTGRLLIL